MDIPPASPAPAPESISSDERQMAMFCHLASLAGYVVPFGNIFGPLVLWLMKRETMPFVNGEGRESVNFQISMTIYMLVAAILCFFCIGVPILIGLMIFDIVVVVLACVESSKGSAYKYPLCIRFIE